MKRPFGIAFILLLPTASFAAETRNCLPFAQMEDLALVNDDTILVTMQDKTRRRVELDRCAGIAKSTAFSYAGNATALCEQASLPVTQAPASCTIRKITDIGADEVTLSDDELADARRAEQEQPRTALAPDAKAFAKFIGDYQVDLDVFVAFTRNGRRYFFRVTGEPAVEVFPESATKFFAEAVPAQVSFAPSVQGAGVDLTLHRDGKQILAKRVNRSVVRASEIALQKRLAQGKPDPARAALLRQYIAAEQSGEIPTDILSPRFLPLVTHLWPALQQANRDLGELKSLDFRRVTTRGADMYAAEYENGNMVWFVGSLTTDRKLVAVTGASGDTAASLEKVEDLRVRLARVQMDLALYGSEPRASDRPMNFFTEDGNIVHPSQAWFAAGPAAGARLRREFLTYQRIEILTHLQQAERELRGEVSILPVQPVPPKEAAP